MVDAWAKCTDKIADAMMQEISAVKKDAKTGREMPINSIYMMAHSGARGSPAQMKQLAGMRGLMAKPSGEIIESPIISNFKEGLSVLEYFNSTHGARKGLADTALKTANSGYLTRRLVDVAQDCIITEEDCGTKAGIKMRAIIDAGQVVASLGSRILGRTAAEDIRDPAGTTVIVKRGTLIEEPHVEAISTAGVQEVKHPLGAHLRDHQRRVRQVLRARSRPRHAGQHGRGGRRHRGAVDRRAGHPAHHAHVPHRRRGADHRAVVHRVELRRHDQDQEQEHRRATRTASLIAMARNIAVAVVDQDGTERAVHRIQYGARMKVDEGDQIKRGQRIAEWDPYTRPILTEVEGTIAFEDLVEGQSMTESLDESTGIAKRVVIDWRTGSARGQQDLRPAIVIKGKDGKILKLARGGEARYLLAVDAIISVDPGGNIKAGDVIARIPTESAKTRDITGGLPRVAELFEARRPKEAAIIAEISGTVRFGKDYKNKRRITIEPTEKGAEPVEYLIPKGKHIHLQDGDMIEKGDYIVDGNPAPHDILAIKGVEELAAYPGQRDPGGLPAAGRADQRQAHRGDRSPDAAEGRDHRRGRDRADQRRAARQDRARRDQREDEGRGQEARQGPPGAARHHQGDPADPLVHLGGVVPGDDARAHRGRRQRQARHARGPQGERHRRPADPGRHRRDHELAARDRASSATRLILEEREKERPRRSPSSSRRHCRRRSKPVAQFRPIRAAPRGGPFLSGSRVTETD